ncbi:MAG: 1-(5-phosphoribosyl)-5-[(5-phosphoribosylamino)methylideneamino]imidazole-4-carboxamide isomerase [Pseudomonadota bacterium]|nr:1-(5-phosphoribosyl)-5-[(5-phosphoribosylamino)methylideneamino]imidazole-4-carboxamide isomerase [Pseudomonadota bacterium]
MILYPAIDLKDGRCVRLLRGDMDAATVFNDDPADQARRFEAAGFAWLHVVDLNGAIEGRAANAEAVRAILGAVRIPVQLGGGVRTFEAVAAWLEAGVRRVILGTAAVRDPALVRRAAAAFPGQVVVGIDARDGMASVDGWTTSSEIGATELARRFEDAGVAALIVTDIARDGALGGVNVEATGALADAVSTPVIASGGVAGAEDIRALRAWPGRPIAGAVLGRALYEGALTPTDALAAAG